MSTTILATMRNTVVNDTVSCTTTTELPSVANELARRTVRAFDEHDERAVRRIAHAIADYMPLYDMSTIAAACVYVAVARVRRVERARDLTASPPSIWWRPRVTCEQLAAAARTTSYAVQGCVHILAESGVATTTAATQFVFK
jgi:hypothetical protein